MMFWRRTGAGKVEKKEGSTLNHQRMFAPPVAGDLPCFRIPNNLLKSFSLHNLSPEKERL
jgi:hypothetical protein